MDSLHSAEIGNEKQDARVGTMGISSDVATAGTARVDSAAAGVRRMEVVRSAEPLRATSKDEIAPTLRAILRTGGVTAGNTFGDFIDACITAGMRMSDPLASIHYGMGGGSGRISIERDDCDCVEIREVRR